MPGSPGRRAERLAAWLAWLWLLGPTGGLESATEPAEPTQRKIQVLVHPEQPAQGELLVVEVGGGRAGDRISGRFQGRSLRFFVDRRGRVRALACAELQSEPGPTPLVIGLEPRQGAPISIERQVAIRAGTFDEQPLRVNPRFVEPPEVVRARIERERAEFKALFEAQPSERKWRGSFAWPRRDTITSRFGLRRTFNGQLESRHLGLDIDGRSGSPVRAIGAGRVVLVAERYYSGGTVVIDHGLRLFSLYYHLSAMGVRPGQRVERGQRIGQVGRSGRVTGPHLHLSTKVEGEHCDPLSLFGFDFDESEARGGP